jgi:hypothetical protein
MHALSRNRCQDFWESCLAENVKIKVIFFQLENINYHVLYKFFSKSTPALVHFDLNIFRVIEGKKY